jgi:aldehyde dehydrogenase (NAD+)
VQEAIDIADFAVGQSRMLYGLSMHSERPATRCASSGTRWARRDHHGVQLPVAVWAWNSMLALVCGDACLWKPSS